MHVCSVRSRLHWNAVQGGHEPLPMDAQTEEAKLLQLWIVGVHGLGWIVSLARRTAVVGVVVGAVVTKHHGQREQHATRQGGNANKDHLVSGFQGFGRPWPV